ncbi:MAG: hypothetical protein HXL35_06875 [Prevotellaceae bacterium]|nr:hypothetical protein [Prevotellaceae bacterium]MBF1062445.1 hypothetical protein [Prevotellaceae bacterium]
MKPCTTHHKATNLTPPWPQPYDAIGQRQGKHPHAIPPVRNPLPHRGMNRYKHQADRKTAPGQPLHSFMPV